MMGSGKSSVGPLLAERLGYRFLDLDAMIERVSGCSIADIFSDHGESEFRQRESAVLEQVACWHSLVVATGGGVVMRPQNWGIMRQGLVIWLNCPKQVLIRRLHQDQTVRPLLNDADPDAKLSHLLAQRDSYYRQADVEIAQCGEESPREVARIIEAALESHVRQSCHQAMPDPGAV
jgi:shikimate kinase